MEKVVYLLLRGDGQLEFMGTFRECAQFLNSYVPKEEHKLYIIVRNEEE